MANQRINLLLLRGLTREISHWGIFLPRLRKSFPRSQIFCLDHPGVGTENKRPSPWTISAITDDLRTRWKKNFSKSKIGDWVCLGHSLGGMVALDWQNRYAKDFVGCALINTTSRGTSPLLKRLQLGGVRYFLQIAASREIPQRETLLLDLVSNQHRKDKKILDAWIEFAKDRPMYPMTPIRQVAAAAMFKARFPSNTPLLFLYSKADRLAHFSCSQELAKKYEASFAEHKKAGHDIALDDPDWVVDELQDFIKKIHV